MLNTITLLGRLTDSPELKQTQSGTFVTSFNLAVPRDFKTKDGQEITDFIPCVAWRKTAEFISKYFQKGSPAVVNGKLETRKYEDKDGNKRVAFEVNIENIYFAGGKNSDKGQETPQPAFTTARDFEEIGGEDDLPF